MRKLKLGFTLAEVLIVVGIVGVIAAISIPMLYQHYKVQVLKNQFKVADEVITQALKNTVTELGYDNLNDLNLNYYVSGGNPSNEAKQNLEKLNDAWIKQFKGIYQIDYGRDIYHKNALAKTMLGEKTYAFYSGTQYLLPNGMRISSIGYNTDSSTPTCLHFTFDTNGPYKGPNRAGYDIFHYYSIEFRQGCNPVRGISSREEGCYWYAHYNMNPSLVQYKETYDKYRYPNGHTVWFSTPHEGRKDEYWDMLYKPRSYWEE